MPVPSPTPIPWGQMIRTVASRIWAPIAALWPSELGVAECEKPGGPLCGGMTMAGPFPPGYWPGDTGASEWGRRNGVGEREGRGRFHGIKQGDKGQGGGKGRDQYGVNPDAGDVVNPEGEVVGNLEGAK